MITLSVSGFLTAFFLYVRKPGFDTEHVKACSVCCCRTVPESHKGFSGCTFVMFENWTAASPSATMPICHHIKQIYIWKASRTMLRFTSAVQGFHFAFACTQSGSKRASKSHSLWGGDWCAFCLAPQIYLWKKNHFGLLQHLCSLGQSVLGEVFTVKNTKR